jgi:hypothetical protein
MADSKKVRFSKSPILKNFLWKFHGLVLGLVELIDAKGIDIVQPIWLWGCLNTQKMHFFLFLRLRWTASRPYRLSYITALCINQSYEPMKFSQNNFENWRFWKTHFFWVGHFDFFFALFPWKSVKATWVSRMGRNFDDYPGLQQKSKFA